MRRGVTIAAVGVACALVSGCAYLLNQPPVAAFDALFDTVEGEPLVVVLDASGSSDPDGDPVVEYLWAISKQGGDLGDGVEFYPAGWSTQRVTDQVITVKFPAQGSYLVQLLVRSERGGVRDDSSVFERTLVLPNEQMGPTV